MSTPGRQLLGRVQEHTGIDRTSFFLVIPFLVEAVLVLITLCAFLFWKNDTTYPESASVLSFVTAASTGHLYLDPYVAPYDAQMYGPMIYVVGSAVAYLCRSHLYETAVVMRMISILSILVTAGVVMWIIQKMYRSRLLGYIAAILVLACPWFLLWGVTARSDTLAIMLGMLALGIYVNRGRTVTVALIVGVLLGLSMLTKQTMLVMAAAILLDSIVAGEWLYVAAVAIGAAVPPLLLLAGIHERSYMLQNVVIASHTVLKYSAIPYIILHYLRSNKEVNLLLVIALAGVPGAFRRREFRPLLFVIVMGMGGSLLALANVGSASNYMILPWILLVLLVPEGLLTISRHAHAARYAVPILSLAALFIIFHERSELLLRPGKNIDASALKEIRLLSNLPYLEVRSKQPEIPDPFIYHAMELHHLWTMAPIAEEVNQEKFDLVILGVVPAPERKTMVVYSAGGVSQFGRPFVSTLNAHYGSFLLCGDTTVNAIVLRPRHRESPQVADYEAFLEGTCKPSSDPVSVYPEAQ